jgi:hypothetical protein
MIRLALMFAGGLMLALGALWALQGLGIIAWPPGSVMLAQREWALYGAITMVIGAVIVWIGPRAGPAKRQ